MELSQAVLETALADISEETLARWYVDLNRWHWPQTCPLPCPDGFDDTATAEEKQQLARPLWEYLHTHTTRHARSRAWWLIALNRSEADWCAFWALPICPYCDMHHPRGTCSETPAVLRWAYALLRGWQTLWQQIRRMGGW